MSKSSVTTNIDVLLLQKGISKKQFYNDCNITSATYSQWNTGKTKPKLANLERIANYLDVSLTYLLATGVNSDGEFMFAEVENETDEKTPAAENGNERIPGYDLLNEENQKFIDDMIEKLLKSQSAE